MKTLVVYDSVFGNTEKIAKAMAEAIGGEAKQVASVQASDLDGVDVLLAGSPTRGFPPDAGHGHLAERTAGWQTAER